jgi:hypothetical protein
MVQGKLKHSVILENTTPKPAEVMHTDEGTMGPGKA